MKKTFLMVLIFVSVYAQGDTLLENHNRIDKLLYFLPRSNDIIGVCIKEFFSQTAINVWSIKDGTLLKEIALEKNVSVNSFNISHDDSSFVVMTNFKTASGDTKYFLMKYLLKENKWAWKKEWALKSPCLRLAYSSDNEQIICVTYLNTVIINSNTGSINFKSSKIASVFGVDGYTGAKMDLSSNGTYFVFWKESNWTGEYGDRGFFPILEKMAQGLGYLFGGWSKKHIIIWDVIGDSIKDKIEIPKKTYIGAPVFTMDEKTLLFGTLKGFYRQYSIDSFQVVNEWQPDTTVTSELIFQAKYDWSGFKVISPDTKYFGCFFWPVAVVRNLKSGLPEKIWEINSCNAYSHYDTYQMAFSSDSKYFVLEDGGKLCMFFTDTWEKVWVVKSVE